MATEAATIVAELQSSSLLAVDRAKIVAALTEKLREAEEEPSAVTKKLVHCPNFEVYFTDSDWKVLLEKDFTLSQKLSVLSSRMVRLGECLC